MQLYQFRYVYLPDRWIVKVMHIRQIDRFAFISAYVFVISEDNDSLFSGRKVKLSKL